MAALRARPIGAQRGEGRLALLESKQTDEMSLLRVSPGPRHRLA